MDGRLSPAEIVISYTLVRCLLTLRSSSCCNRAVPDLPFPHNNRDSDERKVGFSKPADGNECERCSDKDKEVNVMLPFTVEELLGAFEVYNLFRCQAPFSFFRKSFLEPPTAIGERTLTQ